MVAKPFDHSIGDAEMHGLTLTKAFPHVLHAQARPVVQRQMTGAKGIVAADHQAILGGKMAFGGALQSAQLGQTLSPFDGGDEATAQLAQTLVLAVDQGMAKDGQRGAHAVVSAFS
jgi:hypothetical protein